MDAPKLHAVGHIRCLSLVCLRKKIQKNYFKFSVFLLLLNPLKLQGSWHGLPGEFVIVRFQAHSFKQEVKNLLSKLNHYILNTL
jgi:hypothetical protein